MTIADITPITGIANEVELVPMGNIDVNINKINLGGEEINVVSSRDIAKELNKRHDHVVRDIDNIVENGVSPNLGKPIIISSTYIHPQNGQEYREYLLTKDGFTLYMFNIQGHNDFKMAYINKFNEMEQALRNPFKNMSKEMQSIWLLDIKAQEQDKKIKAVDDDLQDFKNNAPLFNSECDELQAEVKKVALRMLGGKNAPAYKYRPTATKVFTDIQHQLKREFDVARYKAIKRKDLEKAKEILREYRLPTYLKEEVELINNQVEM
ncbi:Rha family transcriptional regulator [Peptacetobacter sp.]|uniref:Rha family transcriptional regulator n=1 Tax=Peptacetobacter sp. TaxID=2991975 RepID=UPI003AB1C77E